LAPTRRMAVAETGTPRDNTTLRSAAAHVFVKDLDSPALSPADLHHLERVLRLRSDDEITLGDGAGRWRVAKVSLTQDSFGPVRTISAPKPALRVGFALLKGDRNEWVVQKLTELGVDSIMPLITSRSVVRWEHDRSARHHERLTTVAHQAAMQSRRVWLPEVTVPASLGDLVSASSSVDVALAEPGGRPPSLDRPTILIGPEGGWSSDELALDLPHIGLGPTILRAETAAVVAGTLLMSLRAGSVRPAS
jgi:16S rRNA (uracil1498-N3)-methyltransferase